jgi:germination protein M
MLSNSEAMAKRALCPIALLVLPIALLAGCGGSQQSGSGTTAPAVTTTTTGQQMTARAYFLRDGKVAVAEAQVPRSDGVARAALELLLAGPPVGLETAIPDGTRLRGLTISDGMATVDLSGEFGSGGGSASMLGRLAQVVYTLTQFPSVTGVSFKLDGEPVSTLGGEGVVLDHPQTRADYEEQTPIILVERPVAGDTVSSPVLLAGTSNVFEANMHLDVYQGETKLVDTFLTATSGSGERGTFETSVPLDVTGPVRIVLYAPSAEDGSPQHLVEVPVTVAG